MFTTQTTVAILGVLAIAAALVYTDPTNAMLGRAAASGERDRRAKGAKAGRVIASGKGAKTPKTPKAPKAATDLDPAIKETGMLAAGCCCILPPPHPSRAARRASRLKRAAARTAPGQSALCTLYAIRLRARAVPYAQ